MFAEVASGFSSPNSSGEIVEAALGKVRASPFAIELEGAAYRLKEVGGECARWEDKEALGPLADANRPSIEILLLNGEDAVDSDLNVGVRARTGRWVVAGDSHSRGHVFHPEA
jgi:hypothetical protein